MGDPNILKKNQTKQKKRQQTNKQTKQPHLGQYVVFGISAGNHMQKR